MINHITNYKPVAIENDIYATIVEMNKKLDKLINDKGNTIKPKILTLEDSAKYLSISKSKLKSMIKDELIDLPSKIGGNYFFEIDYLDDFIIKHRSISRFQMTEAVSKTILGLNKKKCVF